MENQPKEKEVIQSTTSKETSIMKTNRREIQRKSFSWSSPPIQFRNGESSSTNSRENPFDLMESASSQHFNGPVKNVLEKTETSSRINEKAQTQTNPNPDPKPNSKHKRKGVDVGKAED